MRDEKRTLECLKKAARIASQCMDTGVQVQICVELLNHYLFYFERGNALITVDLLNQVRFFITSNLSRFSPLIRPAFRFSSIVNCKNQWGASEFGTMWRIQADRSTLPEYVGAYSKSNEIKRFHGFGGLFWRNFTKLSIWIKSIQFAIQYNYKYENLWFSHGKNYSLTFEINFTRWNFSKINCQM